MNNTDLINAAIKVCKPIKLGREFSAGTAGAAILSSKNRIHTGVCIDLACGLGFCAEAAAAAEMLKHGETQVKKVVAVAPNGTLLIPCGRCREMLVQIDERNLNCLVIVSNSREVRMKELLRCNGRRNQGNTEQAPPDYSEPGNAQRNE